MIGDQLLKNQFVRCRFFTVRNNCLSLELKFETYNVGLDSEILIEFVYISCRKILCKSNSKAFDRVNNFHPLEVVSRLRDPQLQVSKIIQI